MPAKNRKISRNELCPCGSKKKYKECCLNSKKEHKHFNSDLFQNLKLKLERTKADELIRTQQQGLGKPIISEKFHGEQWVAVGNKLNHSSTWKTFPDFLGDYLKSLFGSVWGGAEIKKPIGERHTMLQWYDTYCNFQKQNQKQEGKIVSVEPTGVVYCYLGLAYNLYLLEHNIELQERFIKRLKDQANFQGAYYELIVANVLIRAGFKLELEDESDETSKHCEFSAVSRNTNKKYWVEAKMRSVIGYFGKTAANGTKDKNPTNKLSEHLRKALDKPAEGDRLIFIDVNTSPDTENTVPIWIGKAESKLKQIEDDKESADKAYVFMTNATFHRCLESAKLGHSMFAYGFKIPDFMRSDRLRLRDHYLRKQKHIDAHRIIESFKAYTHLPATFDGSLPSTLNNELNDRRLMIGETYDFVDVGDKGVVGTVTDVTISEETKTRMCAIQCEDGRSMILEGKITEEELIEYKKHPEAYFGKIKRAPRKTDDPFELFEFFVESYRNTPKEKLVEFVKNDPQIEKLKSLQRDDLLLEVCERWVASAVDASQLSNKNNEKTEQ